MAIVYGMIVEGQIGNLLLKNHQRVLLFSITYKHRSLNVEDWLKSELFHSRHLNRRIKITNGIAYDIYG